MSALLTPAPPAGTEMLPQEHQRLAAQVREIGRASCRERV